MERIFICNVIPKDLVTTFRVSQAGTNFSYTLIEGNLFTRVFSLLPTNIDVKFEKEKFESNIIPIQCRIFPHILFFKFFNIIIENLSLVSKVKKGSKVWYYNLTMQTLVSYVLLKYLQPKTKVFIIVLDYTPSKKWLSLNGLISYFINSADGIITLAPSQFYKNKNIDCIAGVVPESTSYEPTKNINFNFLYSGIINNKRNIEAILEAFSNIPEFILHISGISDDDSILKEYSKRFSNINYYGYLPFEEYKKLLMQCTFCLNTRNPRIQEYNYNFPSKIIEFFLHNKIVISTIKYPQLNNFDYYFVESQKQDLIKFLLELKNKSFDELIALANQSEKVRNEFSILNWSKVIEKQEN